MVSGPIWAQSLSWSHFPGGCLVQTGQGPAQLATHSDPPLRRWRGAVWAVGVTAPEREQPGPQVHLGDWAATPKRASAAWPPDPSWLCSTLSSHLPPPLVSDTRGAPFPPLHSSV